MATLTLDPEELVPVLVRALEDPRVADALARAIRSREPSEPASYLTPADFAARHRVSKRTVLRWIAQGMPASRAGSVRRVDVEPAEAWLREGGNAGRIERAARLRAARAAGLRAVSK